MSSKKNKFTPQEDALIMEHVEKNGERDWCSVVNGRTGRECRERYKNYLSPKVKKDEWTREEDILLEEKVKECGLRWDKISQFFKGRTALDLKNRWKCKGSHSSSRLNIHIEDYLQDQNFFVNMTYLQDQQLPVDFEFIDKASENIDLNESTAQCIIDEGWFTYQKTQGPTNDTNQELTDEICLDGDIEKLSEITSGL